MLEIIKLIERDFPGWHWLVRNKPGTQWYFAHLHNGVWDYDDLVFQKSFKCLSLTPMEALIMAYMRAVTDKNTSPKPTSLDQAFNEKEKSA